MLYEYAYKFIIHEDFRNKFGLNMMWWDFAYLDIGWSEHVKKLNPKARDIAKSARQIIPAASSALIDEVNQEMTY